MKNLSLFIVGHIGKALKMEEMEMRELFEDGIQMMRINYYPPCPQPEKVIGFTKHSDPGGVTILLQLNEVEGLQIKKNCMWVPVKPHPNAFIVNIGDMLEVLIFTYPYINQLILTHSRQGDANNKTLYKISNKCSIFYFISFSWFYTRTPKK
jgi:hypothetical protein